ncbi:MAG TPA: signal peptide peptidase SppA, partial [Polyangiales bacterium]|nr:signal peptide peptidase SppA [Polyangiales bacterium]
MATSSLVLARVPKSELRVLRARAASALVAVVLALGPAALAQAQLHRPTDPVATPSSSIVLQDDATAIDENPAALGLLPAFSLVYVHAQVDQRGSWLGQGDSLSFATPLLFGLSLGATVQSVRPGPLAPNAGPLANDRALGGLALAFAPSSRFSLGVSARAMTSSNPQLDGLSAVDAGVMWRASDRLGFSVVARDLFASRNGFGTPGLGLGSSLLVGTRFRPFGSSSFVLATDLAIDDQDRSSGRFGVGLRVPYLGYASGVAEIEHMGDRDEALRILAELSATFGGLTLGGGGMGGDGFDNGAGYYALLRLEGQTRPGIPPRGRILDVELADLDERGMLRASLALEGALHDPRIAGVLLRPRDSGIGSAYAQELRLLVQQLRAAGKRVVCHLEDASGAEYYACAGADAVLIDPAGSLRLLGNSTEVLLLGDTLRKVGLRADFVRIGDYKSAPEQLTQGELSEPARAEVRELLDDVHGRTLQDLAVDLQTSTAKVAAIMDDGPQLASQALRDKLVRLAIDESRVQQGELAIFEGRSVVDSAPPRAREDWNAGPSIGVVMVDGSIIDGDSTDIPFLNIHMTGGRSVVDAIEGMVSDPLVRAIVLRVDSPGGAVLASDQIWRAVRRAREQKPVVVSMGAVAASGGYYIASAGDEIWADPSTLTGSIGIFYGKVDVVGLADKLDVGIEVFRRGKRAGAESLFRPFTSDERAALVDRLRSYYQLFLSRVAEGRHKPVEEIDRIARGHVYSGDTAQRLGLVDHLGGFASALARARQLGGVSDDAQVIVRPK